MSRCWIFYVYTHIISWKWFILEYSNTNLQHCLGWRKQRGLHLLHFSWSQTLQKLFHTPDVSVTGSPTLPGWTWSLTQSGGWVCHQSWLQCSLVNAQKNMLTWKNSPKFCFLKWFWQTRLLLNCFFASDSIFYSPVGSDCMSACRRCQGLVAGPAIFEKETMRRNSPCSHHTCAKSSARPPL